MQYQHQEINIHAILLIYTPYSNFTSFPTNVLGLIPDPVQDSTLHYIVLQYFFHDHDTSEKYWLVILYSVAQFEFSDIFLLID